MLGDTQFIVTIALLCICYYQIYINRKRSYYDIDIVNEALTSYRAIGSRSDGQLAPFKDLFSDDPETFDSAMQVIKHYHDISNYETQYICYGFVTYRFIKSDILYLIEVGVRGNNVIIEVYNDETVYCKDYTLITDMCIVLRENFTFVLYISMFSKYVVDGPQQVLHSKSNYADAQKLKRYSIISDCLIQNDIDFGLPHMRVETTTDSDLGVFNDLYTVDVFIGGGHFKVYTDAESDIFYADGERVSRKRFIKLFKLGIKQWVMINKQHREKLRI